MMGNAFSQLVMLLWFPLSLILASTLPPLRAFLLMMFGGSLLLPEAMAFDFPLLPPFDKHAITSLSAWFALLLVKPDVFRKPQASSATRYLVPLIMVASLCTLTTNRDPLLYGPKVIPGLTNHDAIAFVINALIRVALPFYLGQTLIRTNEDVRELLRAYVIGALLYVPLVLLEARLSPIFHIKLYGFFQHSFAQSARAGGFRAFVFMSHGLAVALLISQAITATVGLKRLTRHGLPVGPGLAFFALVAALISCKSMASIIYAIVTVLMLKFSSSKMQLRVLAALCVVVVCYPLARLFELMPLDWFLQQAGSISPDRAQSLEFRFQNEAALLAKAQERLWFGWGGWGRNLLFHPVTGGDMSIADGEWIIQLGTGGLLGFLITFGLLLFPVFSARKAFARLSPTSDDARSLVLLAMLITLIGVDLLPNAISHKLPFLMAGALASVSAGILKQRHGSFGANDPRLLHRNQAWNPPLRPE